MHYRALALVAPALLLLSCSPNSGGVIPDPQAYLSSMGGPKVPTIADTLLKNGQEAEDMGNYPAAAQDYQQLVEKYPDNKDYKMALADAYRRGRDINQAVKIYDGVLASDPNYAKAKEGKGLALLQGGDTDAAAALLEQARASIHGWRAANALGVIAAGKQNASGARDYFNEALKESPNNASVLNNMGLAQAFNQEFEPAIATMNAAQAAAATHPVLRKQVDLNTALVYAAAGKLENAENIAAQYFQGAALDNNLGFYAHVAHDDQLAKTYLNMALSQNKTFYQRAWNNLEALDSSQNAGPALPPKTLTPAQPPTVPEAPLPATAEIPAAPVTLTEPAASGMPIPPAPSLNVLRLPPSQMPAPAEAMVMPAPSAISAPPLPEPQPQANPPSAEAAAPMAPPVKASPPPLSSSPPAEAAPAALPSTAGNAPSAPVPAAPTPKNGFNALGHWMGSVFD